MIPDNNVISGYAKFRQGTLKNVICHAPFVNLNFEQNGNVRACCYNTTHILGSWPEMSVKEIWHGQSANELRDYIKENNLGGGCLECGKMIEAGNYQGVRAKYYDEFVPNTIGSRLSSLTQSLTGKIAYPKVMEFELSNECNLECVMCNGYFSSSIRKNREHLPPIISPYNEKFVDELEEFIPHLTDAKFLGGEPFMIDIYLSIWERIKKINPNIRIHITTNATFLNNRIKDLLESLKAGIILSIDTVVPETYHKIRVNGNLSKVMDNLEYFRKYTARKKTFLSIAACPITYNWMEMPGLLDFCIEKNIALYLNAVFSPADLSLKEQSSDYLRDVVAYLEAHPAPEKKGSSQTPRNLSIQAYNDFIHLLRAWYQERVAAEAETKGEAEYTKSAINYDTVSTDDITWSLDEIRKNIKAHSELEAFGYEDKEKDFLQHSASLFAATPAGSVDQVVNSYLHWYGAKKGVDAIGASRDKISFISQAIEAHPKRKEILVQLSQASPAKFAEVVYEKNIMELVEDLQKFFV